MFFLSFLTQLTFKHKVSIVCIFSVSHIVLSNVLGWFCRFYHFFYLEKGFIVISRVTYNESLMINFRYYRILTLPSVYICQLLYVAVLSVSGQGWMAGLVCCAPCARPPSGSVRESEWWRKSCVYFSSGFIQIIFNKRQAKTSTTWTCVLHKLNICVFAVGGFGGAADIKQNINIKCMFHYFAIELGLLNYCHHLRQNKLCVDIKLD